MVPRKKALCVVTRCATVDEFVETFRMFCDGTSMFVATKAQRPVGLETTFSFQLADRTPVLSGIGIVRDVFATTHNVFNRPGLRLELSQLTPESVAVHGRLKPGARAANGPTSSIARPKLARASTNRIGTESGSSKSTPSNGTPLFKIDDLDLFDRTAPIAIISEDGSVPLVDVSRAAHLWVPPAPTEPEPARVNASRPSGEPREPNVSADQPVPRGREIDVPSTSAAETPASRANEPAASTHRRQLLLVGTICALGGAAIALAIVGITGGSKSGGATTTSAHQRASDAGRASDLGLRQRSPANPAPAKSVSAETVSPSPKAPPPEAATPAVTPTPASAIDGALPSEATADHGRAPAAAQAGAQCKLSIATTPSDSEIRVGDRLLGKSPASFVGDCGAALVEVSHARYETSTRTVTFDGGSSRTLEIRLARPTHKIEIVTSPPGATISIAGHAVGTTPAVVEMKGFTSVELTLDRPGFRRTTVHHYSRKSVDRISVPLRR